MLRSEVKILGLRETLLSGLPLSAIVNLSQRTRTKLYVPDYDRISLFTARSKYDHIPGSLIRKLSRHLYVFSPRYLITLLTLNLYQLGASLVRYRVAVQCLRLPPEIKCPTQYCSSEPSRSTVGSKGAAP